MIRYLLLPILMLTAVPAQAQQMSAADVLVSALDRETASIQTAPDPDALLVEMLSQIAQLANLDQPMPDGTAELMTKAIAVEKECRANARCMAYRAFKRTVLEPMCGAAVSIDRSRAEIAAEKANPSGVIDLQVLHDAGFSIQVESKLLESYKPQFASQMHRNWSRKDCE